MKNFMILAMVATLASMASAHATVNDRREEVNTCVQEIQGWCNYGGSGVRNVYNYGRYMNQNANFCEAVDYVKAGGETGFPILLRIFKMRNGDIRTILINTTNGTPAEGKCIPETWDFKAAYSDRDVKIDYIAQTDNKTWAKTEGGNLYFMRLGGEGPRQARPEWYGVKTDQPVRYIKTYAKSIRVTYENGEQESFQATGTQRLIDSGRAVPATVAQDNTQY